MGWREIQFMRTLHGDWAALPSYWSEWRGCRWWYIEVGSDRRFVNDITQPDFQANDFCTLKVRTSQQYLIIIKQCWCINIRHLGHFFLFHQMCKIALNVSCKFCTYMCCFPEKNYTPGTNFTRPPVAMVATNLNSGSDMMTILCLKKFIYICA